VAVKPSGTGSNPPAGSTPETSSPDSAPAKALEVPEPARPEPRAQPVFSSPKPIVRVPAIYPAAARRDGISGTVLLQAVVNDAGQPTAVNVMRGIRADLDQAAKDALAKWRFQPGTSDGKPVESRVNVEISFSLVQDQRKPISLNNP
jgi:protein TonB